MTGYPAAGMFLRLLPCNTYIRVSYTSCYCIATTDDSISMQGCWLTQKEPGLIHAASAFQAALSTKSGHQLADVHLMYCFSPGRDGSFLKVLGHS